MPSFNWMGWSELQSILIGMGRGSVAIFCNAFELSLQPQVKHWNALFLIFFLYGELHTGVQLSSRICLMTIPVSERRGVVASANALSSNSSMKSLDKPGDNGDPMDIPYVCSKIFWNLK